MTLSVAAVSFFNTPETYAVSFSMAYFYGGFYVVFFTVSFMDIAPYTRNPALWAGMGRVARSAALGLSAVPTAALVQWGDYRVVMMVNFGLFVLSFLLFYLSGSLSYKNDYAAADIDDALKLQKFFDTYGLTSREADVALRLIRSDNDLKGIADDLNIGMRTVQHHITSIYEKTDTKNRVGFLHLVNKEKNS